MNYSNSSTLSTTAKKPRSSSATLALIVGLALLLPVAAALAADPIPGIDIIVQKKPGDIIINAPTGADGVYQFKGLAAGDYELLVGGQRVQTITVGNQGSISGMLSREPDGTASITIGGIADHGTRLIRITNVRANAKAEEPLRDVLPSSRGLVKPFEDQAVKHEQTAPGPGPDGGDGKLPGIAGDPIPGIPVGLEGDPGSIKVNAQTDKTGTFHFDKLPPGKYKLKVHGLPDQSLTVGGDGIARGKVMRGSDGSIGIWDDTDITHAAISKESGDALAGKTGHAPKPVSPGTGPHGSLRSGEPQPEDVKPGISDQGAAGGLISYGTAPPPPKDGGSKAVESPVGFGRGNAGFGGTGPGMMGGGMAPPGPTMGGPMSPGPGPVMGGGPMGPGGAMRGAGAGRP